MKLALLCKQTHPITSVLNLSNSAIYRNFVCYFLIIKKNKLSSYSVLHKGLIWVQY